MPRKPPVVIAFHVVFTWLAVQFLAAGILYVVAPQFAIDQYLKMGGGMPYAHGEDSVMWRVLAIANLATLSFSCAFIQFDVRRFFPVLYPLVVLKGIAAIGYGVAWLAERYPGHFNIFAIDVVTVAAMVYLAKAAAAAEPAKA
jgi:hypothetical protein